jgi:hypothetical protein
MCRAPRLFAVGAILATAAVMVLAEPAPPAAEANVGCTVVTAPAGAITEGVGAITGGAIGGGNPVGDACDEVTDGAVEAVTSPVKSALKRIGSGILGQITTWVSEGATWLMGEVVAEIDKTTTPHLTTEGFLSEYARMTQVASILAAAMFVMAMLEAVIQGSWAVLGKAIFVSVPLAFVGTSIAFVLVQMLLVVTDGMSHAVSVATQEHSSHFFKAAMGDLSKAGGTAGGAAEAGQASGAAVVGEAAGATAVPLFVTCLMAIVGGLAAFCVWIEMVFRDAAVYAVVLFMPLAAAASISPRWTHVLRRYVELIVTVVGSKFVIVSVVALAASLMSEKGSGFEHILAASALLLVACFCPFLLFRLVLSTEAAASAAFARRSAGGHVMNVVQMAGGPQSFANMARSNWSGPEVWSVSADDGKDGGGGLGGSLGRPGDPGARPPGTAGGDAHSDGVPGVGGTQGSGGPGGSGGSGAGAEAGSGVAGAAVSGARVAAHAAQGTAHHLEESGTARIGEETAGAASRPPSQGGGGGEKDGGEVPDREAPQRSVEGATPRGPAEAPPRPPEEGAGGSGGGGADV